MARGGAVAADVPGGPDVPGRGAGAGQAHQASAAAPQPHHLKPRRQGNTREFT